MVFILILLSTFLNIEPNNWVCFKHEQNNVHIDLKEDYLIVRINQDTSNDFLGEYIYQSPYIIKNDTLQTLNTLGYSFLIIDNGIMVSLSNIGKLVKKYDKFYGVAAFLSDGTSLKGGEWKNNKKDGIWLYRDENKDFYRYYYEEDVIIRKEKTGW